MSRNTRLASFAPVISGIGLAVATITLLAIFVYPLELVLGASLITSVHRTTGLLLLGVLPVSFLIYYRFLTPTILLVIGVIGSIIADLSAEGPTAVRLGDEMLVLNTSYLAAIIEGWYVWLLVILLSAVAEHAVRIRWSRKPTNPAIDITRLTQSRYSSLSLAFSIGVIHTAVFIALAADEGEVALMETISVLAVIGGILLGTIPTYLTMQKLLVSPILVLGLIVTGTGVEALLSNVGTPANSYLAFWPVYFGSILIVTLAEFLGTKIVTKLQNSTNHSIL